MSKQISIRVSEDEYSQLSSSGSVSDEVRRRCFSSGLPEQSDVLLELEKIGKRLDGMAEVFKGLNGLKREMVPVTLSNPAPLSFPGSSVSDLDWLSKAKIIEPVKSDYSEIEDRISRSFEVELDFDEREELNKAIKDAGLVWNAYKRTLEKLVDGKYIIIKKF